jgi:pyruvate kinase
MVELAEATLEKLKVVHEGDIIGVVAGTRRTSGSTNFMRLHAIGGDTSGGNRPERRRAPRIKPLSERRKT